MIFGGVLGRVKREEKGIGRRAADDAHLTDAAFEGAFGGFELENHSAGDHAALDQAPDLYDRFDRRVDRIVKVVFNH